MHRFCPRSSILVTASLEEREGEGEGGRLRAHTHPAVESADPPPRVFYEVANAICAIRSPVFGVAASIRCRANGA